MKREIVAVDAALAAREFAHADENESEAVVLALVELLFVDTNAQYEQHRLARRTVQRLADHLAGNVVDAIFAAVLQSETTPIEDATFYSEASPHASTQDRHAVRALPHRSPDRDGRSSPGKLVSSSRGASSPSRDGSRSSSSPEKLATGGNVSLLIRPRRKAAEKGNVAAGLRLLFILAQAGLLAKRSMRVCLSTGNGSTNRTRGEPPGDPRHPRASHRGRRAARTLQNDSAAYNFVLLTPVLTFL